MAAPKKGTLPEELRAQEFQVGPDRSFGILFTVVFGLIALARPSFLVANRFYQLDPQNFRIGAAAIAALFLLLAFVAPKVLHPLNVAWMRLGFVMGLIVSPIVLGILFYLTVVPMGILLRLMGKDLLRLKLDKTAPSYWIERSPPGPAPDTMRNQF